MLRVRIWDLPTRVFHWSLAVLVVTLVITAKTGGNAMVWHMRCGYAVFALLLFRLVWGFAGGYWSRFQSFLFSPKQTWRYLRGECADPPGHSPLGALSVFALLGALAAQVASGLFTDDEIAFSGPFTLWASSNWISKLTWYHTEVGQWLVIALVVLHVCAIAFYVGVRGKALIRPMVDGDKWTADSATAASRDTILFRALAAMVLMAAIALVAWLVQLPA